MAIIRSLVVSLRAKTDDFRRGLKGGKEDLKGFAGQVQKTKRTLGRFGAALAGIASAGLLLRFAKNTLESVDATNKLSKSLGIATEQFTALAFAADLSGATQDHLRAALAKLQETISQGNRGINEQRLAFEEMGLSVESLIRMSPERQLRAIADGFRSIGLQADRIRVLRVILGDAGDALIPLLDQGSEGIRELTQSAHKANATFTALEARFASFVNDEITTFKAEMNGLGRDMVLALSETNKELGNLADHLVTLGKFGSKIRELIGLDSLDERVLKSANEFYANARRAEGGAAGLNRQIDRVIERRRSQGLSPAAGSPQGTAIVPNPPATAVQKEGTVESVTDTLTEAIETTTESLEDKLAPAIETIAEDMMEIDEAFREGQSVAAREVRGISNVAPGSTPNNPVLNVAVKQLEQQKEQTRELRELNEQLRTGAIFPELAEV